MYENIIVTKDLKDWFYHCVQCGATLEEEDLIEISDLKNKQTAYLCIECVKNEQKFVQ